jgi:hypothetical protein
MEQKTKDWMPRKRTALYEQVVNTTVPYIHANLQRFGIKTGTALEMWYNKEFMLKGYDPYVTAYEAWEDPSVRTKMSIVHLKEAEKVFHPLYRELYRVFKANPLVENDDLEQMGFPLRTASGYLPAPIAILPPEFNVSLLPNDRVRIEYYAGAGSKGKPKGQRGVEIKWECSETEISDTNQLTNSAFNVASPAILSFHGKDPGSAVYLALCWENIRKRKGPWSRIEKVYVP